MKNYWKSKLLLTAIVSVFLLAVNSCTDSVLNDQSATNELQVKNGNIEKQSYIVVLSDNELNTELTKVKGYEKKGLTVQSAAAGVLKRAGIADGEIGFVYSTALTGFSVKIPPGQLKQLEDDPSVKSVEKDQVVSLNPIINKGPSGSKPGHGGGGNGGGGGTTSSETIPWGISRVGGPVNYTGSGVAWIIDTGVDFTHPDLNVGVSQSATFVSGTTNANDDNGHGTHVAGIIAAIYNNGIGVAGVAAGATVVPVKVLNRRGSGTVSGVIAGVDYVAVNGHSGDVANMSLGGGISTSLDNAVLGASGVVKFAIAAGNDAADASNYSPARVNGSNVYTISAMDNKDDWAYFSNYGPPVDYCEPGVNIYSCYKNDGYATLSGTSMATPHMAGLLLLGKISTGGYVNDDPDHNNDPIGVHN